MILFSVLPGSVSPIPYRWVSSAANIDVVYGVSI